MTKTEMLKVLEKIPDDAVIHVYKEEFDEFFPAIDLRLEAALPSESKWKRRGVLDVDSTQELVWAIF